MNIAKAIADLRVRHNMSQEELAAILFVSRDLVSKWEAGARRPDWQMIERIAEVFDVSTDAIADKNELVVRELENCLPRDSPLTAEELAAVLNSFLQKLSDTDADMFIQRYYFLVSVSDIASSFHLKENHIRSTLSRTRKKLKKFIREVSE